MTINDRNRLAFGYTNHDASTKSFLLKNFNKAVSYNSNFSGCTFDRTSLVGTKFKFCNMARASFKGCLIRGALFRKCNLDSAVFSDCIIAASTFEKAKLKNAQFINCKVIGSTNLRTFLPEKYFVNTEFYDNYPPESSFDLALVGVVNQLREHDLIRRSTVLHRKKGKLDTISLGVLVEEFGESNLVAILPEAALLIEREFHTLSYIQNVLRKVINGDSF
ncbi:TPA: pentapeptide repeat-containing protein [Vibrio cholerae]|uniref:pentapeptide repeat-containing protein n=1 Tax=Vibrio cholerae TaxID=666 RepID=UPI000E0C5F28|nr:pentapeptide repeat-containing protein [Vibrio cholerae]EGR1045549.1 hypothetical protein [Vibrio cholerae]EJL6481804.1 pentapeptide repeat-containing protein [Vibrio cholerae]ELJ8688374.1 pentapeptide repeat-containing protein [Vibrio cholerae]HDZ9325773.1 pentapeptide repeat-containing protein [Vibrio cholerae]